MALNDPAKKLVVTEIDARPTGQMPSTVRFEKLLTEAIELAKHGIDIASKTDAKVDMFGAALTTVAQDVAVIKAGRAADDEVRRKHSGSIAAVDAKAEGASSHNLQQDAALATVIVEQNSQKELLQTLVKKTDLQTEILTDLRSVAANPMVRRVAYAIGLAILGYFASKGWVAR